MINRVTVVAAMAACLAVTVPNVTSAGVVVREMGSRPLSAVEPRSPEDEQDRRGFRFSPHAMDEPAPLLVYPIGGTIGGDVAIPYFVDLDGRDVRLDWNCSDLTFNGHSGHDAYIRGFDEQEIGVPVFAARDGVVVELRDGEPDQNTSNTHSLKANYLTLDHGDGLTTQYVHLRRGSMPFQVGDRVVAGAQIGLVGSSGPSTAPHLHFEAAQSGRPFEPMAGPCRAGRTGFLDSQQPPMADVPHLLGVTLSRSSFDNYPAAPWNDAPNTGTFVRGPQMLWFRADVANVGFTTRYALRLVPPGSDEGMTASAGSLLNYDASLASVWWGLEVDLDETGTWMLELEINDRQEFSIPFTVVTSHSQIVNRAPHSVAVSLEPVGMRSGQVPVCMADGSYTLDPDYDTVRYTYMWRVNGQVVRNVTTAARSDALSRDLVRAGAEISCSVTPSDGQLTAATSTAYATVQASRRRAVEH